MRLSEHLLHEWDVRVTLDPSAALAPDGAAHVIGNLGPIVAFAGKPTGGSDTVVIATTEPEGQWAVDHHPRRGELRPHRHVGPGPRHHAHRSARAPGLRPPLAGAHAGVGRGRRRDVAPGSGRRSPASDQGPWRRSPAMPESETSFYSAARQLDQESTRWPPTATRSSRPTPTPAAATSSTASTSTRSTATTSTPGAGKYKNPFKDLRDTDLRVRNWDDDRRDADQLADGVVGEVDLPEHRAAVLPELRAVRRAAQARRVRAPPRRHPAPTTAGWSTSAPASPSGAPASARSSSTTSTTPSTTSTGSRSNGLRGGVLLPDRRPRREVGRSRSTTRSTTRCGPRIQDLDIPVNLHSGTGSPDYGRYAATPAAA